MNIHYAKEFEQSIAEGKKIHTLRKYGVEKGTIMKHVVYPYTKDKRRIVREDICTGWEKLDIKTSNKSYFYFIVNDNTYLSTEQIVELAINDGFNSADELIDYIFKGFDERADMWWSTLYLNHWTDKRYEAKILN